MSHMEFDRWQTWKTLTLACTHTHTRTQWLHTAFVQSADESIDQNSSACFPERLMLDRQTKKTRLRASGVRED